MSVLDDKTIEIPCRKCGQKHQKTIGWLKANNHLACSCGVILRFDMDEFIAAIKKAEDAIESIPRNITISFS
jgi:hypothetical protein